MTSCSTLTDVGQTKIRSPLKFLPKCFLTLLVVLMRLISGLILLTDLLWNGRAGSSWAGCWEKVELYFPKPQQFQSDCEEFTSKLDQVKTYVCLDVFFFEKEVEMRWLQFVSRQTAVVAIEVLHMTSCVCRSRAVRHIGRDNHLGSSNNNVAGCSHPPLIFLKQLIYSLSVITSWKIQVLDWKRVESLKELQRTTARTLFITDNVSVLGTEL